VRFSDWFLCAQTSPAIARALALPDVPRDFRGVVRGQYPDIGGLQHRVFRQHDGTGTQL
jgi:hypothetical protein